MTNTTTRIGLTLALALVGLGGAGRAQEVSGEPPTSEATPELIAPEIDAPALPSMTEEAAQEPTSGAAGSSAFNDLTPPDMSAPRSASEYRTCPDREERPEWLETLDPREADRGLLLMRIYEARNYERIVTTGDCSCAVKAPSWEAAEAEYQEKYAALDLQAQDRAENEFREIVDQFRREARRICQAQGNW